MHTTDIVQALKLERERVNQAIELLEGKTETPARSIHAVPTRRRRHRMSASARRRISEAQKLRWKLQKAKQTYRKAA